MDTPYSVFDSAQLELSRFTLSLLLQAREAFAALSMQVTEYMTMNHYHPNKAKILRIEKDWYDPDTERDDMEGTFKLSTVTSSSSLSGLVQNGMYFVLMTTHVNIKNH